MGIWTSIALVEVYQKLAEAEKQIADEVSLLDGEEVLQNLRRKYVRAYVLIVGAVHCFSFSIKS